MVPHGSLTVPRGPRVSVKAAGKRVSLACGCDQMLQTNNPFPGISARIRINNGAQFNGLFSGYLFASAFRKSPNFPLAFFFLCL